MDLAPPPPPPPPPVLAKRAMNMGFALRVGMRLQNFTKPKNMDELHLDTSYNAVEARFSGDVTDNFGWTADFNAQYNGGNLSGVTGAVGLEDLIVQYKACKEFNIWAGRLLVPSDRSNFSGPFFMSPWNYPGFYIGGAAPIGPMDGPNGRDQGVVVWGNAGEDKLKYYAGAFGLDKVYTNGDPYYSGRISYTLQGSEPGYWGSSTYYGAKNVITIGVGGQYQKSGSSVDPVTMASKETAMFMADALVEENVPGAGTFTFEGQFYKFNDGYMFSGPKFPFAPKEAFYALVSYLTPEPLGIGKLQPLVRLQQTVDPAWTIIDGGLTYVIKDYFLKIALNYQHIDTGTGGAIANAMQLGLQIQQ
jgi:hypothetical protein